MDGTLYFYSLYHGTQLKLFVINAPVYHQWKNDLLILDKPSSFVGWTIPDKEKVVMHRRVWLRERNDELARELIANDIRITLEKKRKELALYEEKLRDIETNEVTIIG